MSKPYYTTLALVCATALGLGGVKASKHVPDPNLAAAAKRVLPDAPLYGAMGPEEGGAYMRYIRLMPRWSAGQAMADEMNKAFGLQSRNLEARLVIVERSIPLGQAPRFALVLHNRSEQPHIVFPFRVIRQTDRGNREDSVRTDIITIEETFLKAQVVYVVPPGDELVIPLSLSAQPGGLYRAKVLVSLSEFADMGGTRAFLLKPLRTERVLEFDIQSSVDTHLNSS